VLVLHGPGGDPLARCLGAPTELGRYLHLAISPSAALAHPRCPDTRYRSLRFARRLAPHGPPCAASHAAGQRYSRTIAPRPPPSRVPDQHDPRTPRSRLGLFRRKCGGGPCDVA
jgi:hypothetical protein